MIEPNVKVYVNYKDYRRVADCHIVIENKDGSMGIVAPIQLVFEHKTEEQLRTETDIPPTFSGDPAIMNAIIKGFAKLAEERGIPTETEGACRAELKATKYHLEDVRKVAKLTEGL